MEKSKSIRSLVDKYDYHFWREPDYVIYFLHDLHGFIEGVTVDPPISDKAVIQMRNSSVLTTGPYICGGIEAISEFIKQRKAKWVTTKTKVIVCLGGDMVRKYGMWYINEKSVIRIWRDIMKKMEADIFIYGNHEMDFREKFYELTTIQSKKGCTRNIVWYSNEHPLIPRSDNCNGEDIPEFASHCFVGETPFIFIGMVKDYRKQIGFRFNFTLSDFKKIQKKQFYKQLIGAILNGNRPVKSALDYITNVMKKTTNNFEYPSDVIYSFNKVIKQRSLFNKASFAGVISKPEFIQAAGPLYDRLVNNQIKLSKGEKSILNRLLLMYSFQPPLGWPNRYYYKVDTPKNEYLNRCFGNCRNISEEKNANKHIHILVAHYGDERPEEFSKLWMNHVNNGINPRPHLILKAHDHYCSFFPCEGVIDLARRIATRETKPNPNWIPTFEAGANGHFIGELKLKADNNNQQIRYRWQLISGPKTKADGKKLSYYSQKPPKPIVEMADFNKFGGSLTDSDMLFRAANLMLEGLANSTDSQPLLAMSSPSEINTDSRVPIHGDIGNEIRKVDLEHVFGESERRKMHILPIPTIDLIKGIEKAFSSKRISSTILPPIEGEGGGDPLKQISEDEARNCGFSDDTLNNPEIKIACSFILHYENNLFLIAKNNTKGKNIDMQVYEISYVNTNNKGPMFRRRFIGNYVEEVLPKLRSPILLSTSDFIIDRCGWAQANRLNIENVSELKLIDEIAKWLKIKWNTNPNPNHDFWL